MESSSEQRACAQCPGPVIHALLYLCTHLADESREGDDETMRR